MIEAYEELIISASTNYTSGNSGSYTGSLSSLQEVERQQLKKNQLINGFDGFESFLYTSSSLSWPYNGNNRLLSTNASVNNWYDNIIELSTIYDLENPNYLLNNIPSGAYKNNIYIHHIH